MSTRWQLRLGLGAWVLLSVPPVRHALQATMTLHMLVQIPLLALTGWLLSGALPPRVIDGLASWNRSGISGFVLISVTATVWMLPLSLDAALEVAWVTLAKFLSVPLLIGLPLALSWPRAGFVVRGIFLIELLATTFRLSWLYLAADERLCSNYLLNDQQQLGKILLYIGIAIFLFLAWKLMWGHFYGVECADSDDDRPPGIPARLQGKKTLAGARRRPVQSFVKTVITASRSRLR